MRDNGITTLQLQYHHTMTVPEMIVAAVFGLVFFVMLVVFVGYLVALISKLGAAERTRLQERHEHYDLHTNADRLLASSTALLELVERAEAARQATIPPASGPATIRTTAPVTIPAASTGPVSP